MAYRGPLGFKLPRVVPWSTWAEWVDVYHWLFSGDAQSRAQGVARVKAWTCRGHVPLSVEATANLVEITLHDVFPPVRSANELRMVYAMALIRFVNGLVEKEQGSVAKSIAVIAESLGLPRVLVDLRHSATHKRLPSLPALRQGCFAALTWLNESYWSKQERQLIDVKTVVHYRLNRWENLYEESGKAESLAKCTKKIIEKVNVNHVTTVLIPYLLDHIVPETGKPINKVLQCWKEPIARFTAEWPHFLPSLLIVLIDQFALEVYKNQKREMEKAKTEEFYLAGHKPYYVTVIAKWLKYILKTDRCVKALQNSFIEMPFPVLLENLLRLPDKRAISVAKKLLPLVHLKKGFRTKLKQIINLHPDSMAKNKKRKRTGDDAGLDAVTLKHSFEQFKHYLNTQQVSAQQPSRKKLRTLNTQGEKDTMEDDDGGWAICEEWQPSPLGMVKSKKFHDLRLPVELDQMIGARFLVPRHETPASVAVQGGQGAMATEGREEPLYAEEDDNDDPFGTAVNGTTSQKRSNNNKNRRNQQRREQEQIAKGSKPIVTPSEIQLLFPVEELISL